MVSIEAGRPTVRQEGKESERKKVGVLAIISGPSGAGKSDVANMLMERYPGMRQVISTTTRGAREGEIDGVHYDFIDKATFAEKMERGEFLETNNYRNEFYGTPTSVLAPLLEGQDMVWVVNMGRAADIQEHFQQKYDPAVATLLSERTLPILIGVPSLLEAKRRVVARDGDGTAFLRSIKTDWEVWSRPGNQEKFQVVINETDALEETMNQVVDLIEGRRQELKHNLPA